MYTESKIKKITDPVQLYSIALENLDESLRATAVETLLEEKFLVKLITNSKDVYVRFVATQKILDNTMLKKIAMNPTESTMLRATAIQKLSDRKIHETLVFDENPQINRIAVESVTDKMTLERIAIESRDPILRKKATEKIVDEKILKSIVANDESLLVKTVALQRLPKDMRITSYESNSDLNLVKSITYEKEKKNSFLLS